MICQWFVLLRAHVRLWCWSGLSGSRSHTQCFCTQDEEMRGRKETCSALCVVHLVGYHKETCLFSCIFISNFSIQYLLQQENPSTAEMFLKCTTLTRLLTFFAEIVNSYWIPRCNISSVKENSDWKKELLDLLLPKIQALCSVFFSLFSDYLGHKHFFVVFCFLLLSNFTFILYLMLSSRQKSGAHILHKYQKQTLESMFG